MMLIPVGILSKLKVINNTIAVVPKKISIADAINSDDLNQWGLTLLVLS